MLALQVVALDFLPSTEFSVPRIPPVQEETNIAPSSVSDPDPPDPHVFGPPDPDPDPLVRDIDPDPALSPDRIFQ
jgi:hypothetical protein